MNKLTQLSEKFFDLFTISTSNSVEEAESEKRCLANALQRFLKSGLKEDAFTVYFCYCEIFNLFGTGYDNTKKMLELLSDHEYHSGELLSKHRDHYSHSVYVFALGLAIYANDATYRNSFLNFYNYGETQESAFQFLKFWGMVALFHDIGYPFQLAHEQVKTYVEEVWGTKDEKGEKIKTNPYVSYPNILDFIALNDSIQQTLKDVLRTKKKLPTTNNLLAYGLQQRVGYNAQEMLKLLYNRVVEQQGFMDHGYFSAIILAKQLFSTPNFEFSIQHLDALTAILLHNSLNKYDIPGNLKKYNIPNVHPITLSEHPLAYLISLCDELQCWDRLAYGKASKRDPIAWKIRLEIADNKITIKYYYDSYQIRKYDSNLRAVNTDNKNYAEMRDEIFVEQILGSKYVFGADYTEADAQKKERKYFVGYIASSLQLIVQTEEEKKERKTRTYASDDNFVNLFDLAKAIHASYNNHCKGLTESRIAQDFAKLPLEFKVSNIEQAKSYADKLEHIDCFYSSKDLDYPIIENLGGDKHSEKLDLLSREEHVRWVREKLASGWSYGTEYADVAERNKKKIHKSIVPYDVLPDTEKEKNRLMINNIFNLMEKFTSNIKVYNYPVGKPKLNIAATGHRYFKESTEVLKEQIKKILKEYSKMYNVTVHTCFAYGADQLIAECAAELGIAVEAVLPMDYESYVADVKNDAEKNGHPFTEAEEKKMRHLLAQTVKCNIIVDNVHTYAGANDYLIKHCDKLIALWDGEALDLHDKNENPINRGGTYDCIRMAMQKGLKMQEDIIVIKCYR